MVCDHVARVVRRMRAHGSGSTSQKAALAMRVVLEIWNAPSIYPKVVVTLDSDAVRAQTDGL